MGGVLRHPLIRVLCIYLAMAMTGLFFTPRPAAAAFISHQPERSTAPGSKQVPHVREAMEKDLLVERLVEIGLTREKALARTAGLSPAERRRVLEAIDSLQAGGTIDPLLAEMILGAIILYYLLPFIIIGAILSGAVKADRKAKRSDPDKARVSFSGPEAGRRSHMPYGGEVKVLKKLRSTYTYDPVGTVQFRGIGEREQILDRMKEKAALHGADTLILKTGEPRSFDGVLHWAADAYRSK